MCEQPFVQFFPGPDPCAFNLAIRSDRLCHIEQLHAGHFGYKNLSTLHLFQAPYYETRCAIECDPEPGHARIRDRDFPPFSLLDENWDHAAPAAEIIAKSHATKAGFWSLSVVVCLDEILSAFAPLRLT